jgi:hypothetical protein
MGHSRRFPFFQRDNDFSLKEIGIAKKSLTVAAKAVLKSILSSRPRYPTSEGVPEVHRANYILPFYLQFYTPRIRCQDEI